MPARRPLHDHAASTWPATGEASPILLLVPVGSCEQHGPHLPLDTDTRIAVAVAEGVARLGGRLHETVRVAPAVAYGSSGEHQAFPGTLSIGSDALTSLLVELGRSAFPEGIESPYSRVVFVNGHGGNVSSVAAARDLLVSEGRAVDSWWPRFESGDAHAGRTETSLLLEIAPDLVGADRDPGNTSPLSEIMDRLRDSGVRAVSPNGVLGDPSEATAAEGRRLLAAMVDELVAFVRR